MRVRMFQVDAFTDRLFAGNPAAVCLLEEWPGDARLQAVAAENNLSETAFLVPSDAEGEARAEYELRWFTPTTEVDLCGHATLAAAFVVLGYVDASRTRVRFRTASGELNVRRTDGLLRMSFPALPPTPCPAPEPLVGGLGADPEATLGAKDYLAVYASPEDVAGLDPNFDVLSELDLRGVIATAPAPPTSEPAEPGGEARSVNDPDFVSRFFAPRLGVPEDPVTGSAHCTLAPYWAERLDLERVTGRQISGRGGTVVCELKGDRVELSGRAVLYLEGWVRI